MKIPFNIWIYGSIYLHRVSFVLKTLAMEKLKKKKQYKTTSLIMSSCIVLIIFITLSVYMVFRYVLQLLFR